MTTSRESRFTRRGFLGASTAAAAAAVLAEPVGPASAVAVTPSAARLPAPILEHARYLAGLNEPEWYEKNIPFIDLPDRQIQDAYYYRWRVYKEHLRYTNTDDGYVSTEFLDCCDYAAPYQAINAAAGHHITEGRWLRDRQYGDDEIAFWLTGPGAGPKPQNDLFGEYASDWAHQYSFWLASAAYGRAQVTGDFRHLERLLPQLVTQYRGWDNQYDAELGLYWSVPVWDAMEFAAPGYYTADPYHGGDSFRTTLNSYQYGDAVAIAAVAERVGDRGLASEYRRRAGALRTAMTTWLWDPKTNFYYSILKENNPTRARIPDREQVGYLPWMFGAADASSVSAWEQLTDPQGFGAPFGPTTLERRSQWFMKDAQDCCRWNGPSWPFSTSQTLTGLAQLLQSGQGPSPITVGGYADALRTYARTQTKNGVPYVAEAHDPDADRWLYDGAGRSEDYFHSSYVDLVLSGLLGIRPQPGDRLTVQPLIPASWTNFVAENVPYHGRNLTIVWDRDGSVHQRGAGLRVWVDGRLAGTSRTLTALTVRVPTVLPDAPARLVNDAANPLRIGFPRPIASYTWQGDDPWRPLDGKIWYDEVPENTRWTNYSSPNPQDFYGVDFGLPTPVSDLRWYGYDDGGGVRAAADYRVQYLRGPDWIDVPGQTRSSASPRGNGVNRVVFPTVTTTQLRVLFTNPPGAFVGVTEFETWSASSGAARLTLGPVGAGGAVLVDGRTSVTVDMTNTATAPLVRPRTSIAVPEGWTAERTGSPRSGSVVLRPGGSAQWTFTLTPPADLPPGTDSAVVATAEYRMGSRTEVTHRRALVRVAYPQGPAEPVGRWPMDEGAGTVLTDAAGSQDLTIAGGPSWIGDSGHSGLLFSSAGQSAESAQPVVDTVGPFTVSAWVRLDRSGSFATAVSQDGAGTSAFFLQYSQPDQRLAFSTEQGRALADAPPELGRWYRLVGVHDANTGTATLYVDGVAQKRMLSQASGVPSTGPFAIGRALAGGNRVDWWPGAVSAVTVWARALSPSDIAALR